MVRPVSHPLADALRRAQTAAPNHILRGPQLPRKDRTLLLSRGFLVEIIKGWYALTTPQSQPGDTTFWHAHFWAFASAYLESRYGRQYSLSAEHSLDLWTGNLQTPKQLIVIAPKGGVFTIRLPNDASILIYPDRRNLPRSTESLQGVQVMPLALALARVSPAYFSRAATNAEIALRLARVEELSRVLLSGDAPAVAGARLGGALRHCGLNAAADRLEADLAAAGLPAKPADPFERPAQLPAGLAFTSPYVARLEAMWVRLRPAVATAFPSVPRKPPAPDRYVARVREIYTHDAYHSLSIEGYQVTPDLIQQIADGAWNPNANPADQVQVNAMAAKGYHDAFQRVIESVQSVLARQNAGAVAGRDLQDWYRALFSPSVQSGILPAHALAGYRDRPVFIRGSEHVPPPRDALPSAMETFFALLRAEPSPAVRAVLGHFMFVFIHPYSDGNGRLGRFLMNVMLASGGYNWTVVRLERRPAYMAALEDASVRGNIEPFTRLLAAEMRTSAKFKR